MAIYCKPISIFSIVSSRQLTIPLAMIKVLNFAAIYFHENIYLANIVKINRSQIN